MEEKKTSLKNIADHLGIGVSTVSMVLNGKAKEARISESLARKIIETAEELHYSPNLTARSLRKGETNTIGVIVADISNAFFVKIIRAIENEAIKHGYRAFFCSSDESDEKTLESIDRLINQQVDGLIIAPTYKIKNRILELKKSNFPFVLIDRFYPKIDTNYVIIDNFLTAYNAVSVLLERGYKRVATFRYASNLFHMEQRFKGYKAALKAHKIRFDSRWENEIQFYNLNKEELKEKIRYNIEEVGVDAIFFPTNRTAIPSIQAIYELGYKIPEDIAVFCFDDSEFFEIMNPSITSIAQPVKEIGKRSVQILVEEIKNSEIKKIKTKLVLNTELKIRNSI